MKTFLTLAAIIAIAIPAVAFDLDNRAPDKPAATVIPPPADPDVMRQGGDTIPDAVMVTLPANTTGTTAGYNHDYDEVCPYTGSLSPDVVYTFIATADMFVEVDLFGSTYDTKVYVYDENLTLIACNDDFYPDYVSKIEDMPVINGVQYFVVIDGYGSEFGNYVMAIDEFFPPPPCIIDCPDTAEPEGEPPLAVDYEDTYNGGCAGGGSGWQYWDSPELCGVSGFYLSYGGNSRDTDWFEIPVGPDGYLEIEGDAELETYMFELGPQDCSSVGVIQNVVIGPCNPASMTIIGDPGSIVWFWVGPTTFESPDGSDVYEYTYYLINLTNVVAVEEHTWSDVKTLFR